MKALSIKQPWAFLVAHRYKNLENRDWKTGNPSRKHRGPFLIHASNGMTKDECEDCFDLVRTIPGLRDKILAQYPQMSWRFLKENMCGGIVGIATFDGEMVKDHDSPWFFGPEALVIKNATPLPFTPHKGQLGFFDIPIDPESEISRHIEIWRKDLAL